MITPAAFGFAISFAGAAVPAAGEIDLTGTLPSMVIRQADAEHEWPFSIDAGELTCVQLGRPRYVFFAEILTEEEQGTIGNMTLPRRVVVSTNPLAFLATIEDRELYAPFDSLEVLIRRLAPYERMGLELCDKAKEL